jgi:N-acetylmuramidase
MIMATLLTDADYAAAAESLGCEIAAIRAVADVESAGEGFNADGTPKILFEGHKFSQFTEGEFDTTHPTLSYPKWSRQFYGKTQAEEHRRLTDARKLHSTAALLSTSWGKFQIMGFNFGACGFTSVDWFVSAMCSGEKAQLDAFVEYIKSRGLADELVEHRWSDFARLYNGPQYAVNRYDTKMAAAYRRYDGLA